MRTLIAALTLAVLVLGTAGAAHAGWEEGVAAFKAGNYSVAAKEFQGVVEATPDFADGYFMLGQSLAQLNRHQDAVNAYRKAYDLKPSDVKFQFALANSYLAAKRYGDAAQLYDRINPSGLPAAHQAAYHKNKAIALDKSGRSGDALGSLRDIARTSPNDASAQYAYGVAAYNSGDGAAAVTALGKAVQLQPSAKHREAYFKALVRQAREDASKKTSNYAKAVEQAKALTAANASYDNLMSLGEAQLGAKQYQGAADSFQQASAKRSNDWLAFYYLSQAQTALGQYAAAENALDRALRTSPTAQNEKRIYRQIGFVKEKLKNYEEAKVAYTRAGDQASVTRVEQNQQIAQENQGIEEHNRQIEQMRKEQEALEKELRELEEGGPPLFD
ncbi:MAG TPA: tetratricopeptide repeat protein [Thermoanaerobaculia bacterium]|nr:tetratricopeptide repeat protein [Thermoanaerobaculia bacterium]